jgi:hypothetical protein
MRLDGGYATDAVQTGDVRLTPPLARNGGNNHVNDVGSSEPREDRTSDVSR